VQVHWELQELRQDKSKILPVMKRVIVEAIVHTRALDCEDLIDLLTTSSTSAALRTLRTHGLLLGPEVVAIAKFVFGICSFALPAKNPSDW